MYSILRNEPLRRQLASDAGTLLITQAMTLLPALLITQLFYHWKSFLLEFLGFLVTWFVIDLVVTTVRDVWAKFRRTSTDGNA
jgi:flagellar biosynthesis protein FliP